MKTTNTQAPTTVLPFATGFATSGSRNLAAFGDRNLPSFGDRNLPSFGVTNSWQLVDRYQPATEPSAIFAVPAVAIHAVKPAALAAATKRHQVTTAGAADDAQRAMGAAGTKGPSPRRSPV